MLAAGVLYLASYDPEKWDIPLFCPFHAVTGLLCPGCGSLRALHDLLNMRISAAFRHNALSSSLAVLAPFALLLRGRIHRSPFWGAGFVAVITAFWVARNL